MAEGYPAEKAALVKAVLKEPPDECMSTNQAVELAPHDREVKRRVEADFLSESLGC